MKKQFKVTYVDFKEKAPCTITVNSTWETIIADISSKVSSLNIISIELTYLNMGHIEP